ncbi:MAG: hypothetical protein ABI723_19550 [Bacteroidia bacterium]
MNENNLDMEAAVLLLLDDYLNDKELTAFTALDSEPLYDYSTNK